MASENKQPLSTRAEEDIHERVERYRDDRDLDNKGDALEQIIRRGLREAEGPLAHRLRHKAMDASFYLAMTSVVVLVIGGATQMLSAVRAVAIAMSIMTVAVAALAGVECLRWVSGQSPLRQNE